MGSQHDQSEKSQLLKSVTGSGTVGLELRKTSTMIKKSTIHTDSEDEEDSINFQDDQVKLLKERRSIFSQQCQPEAQAASSSTKL